MSSGGPTIDTTAVDEFDAPGEPGYLKTNIWTVLRQVADRVERERPDGVTVGDVRAMVAEIEPAHSRRMIDATFVAAATNLPGRLTTIGVRPSRAMTVDLFYRMENLRYRAYRPGVDPTPLYYVARRRELGREPTIATTDPVVEAVTIPTTPVVEAVAIPSKPAVEAVATPTTNPVVEAAHDEAAPISEAL
jgi:hypothetical protein